MISAIHLEQSLYWIWNWYWSVPSEKKKWDLGIFTLPPCIQVLLHAEWSSHTMTMEESGWSGYRWEDQSRFSGVCRYQSFLEIPEKIQKKNNTTWVTVNLHRPSKVSKDQSRLLNIVYIVKLHIWIVQFTKIGRAIQIYWTIIVYLDFSIQIYWTYTESTLLQNVIAVFSANVLSVEHLFNSIISTGFSQSW